MSITASERLDQIKVTVALFNAAPGAVYLTNFVPFAGNTGALISELVKDPAFTAIYPTYLTDAEFAGRFIDSLIGGAAVGGANPAATVANAKSYYAARLAAGETRAQVAQDLIHDLGITSESDPIWGNVAKQFNNKVAVAEYYSVDLHGSATNVGALQAVVAGVTATTPVATAADKNAAIVAGDSTATPGQVLKITAGLSGSADVLGLTGDQDVRIDFTNPANQIKGLDLNGDGVIANDGKENVITGKAANFEIVDAYSRNPLNELDRAHNFLGDISFDGTGFQGDGVNTDGNIVLGGLGVDTIFGGIGNDFLTGGGIASARIAQARDAWIAKGGTAANFVAPSDSLSGGRNADFFFVELSALDSTDGNNINIDGGTTADDNAAGINQSAQDADWLLFEGSDDDEPTTITLRDDSTLDVSEVVKTESGSVVTRSGKQVGTLKDIENFDASGNLYGFLNNLTAKLGGAGVDGRVVQAAGQNNGIGSSAQLNVIGSEVGNIIIGGYDNDHIEGNGGNDILLGGNLAYLINPNLLSITNDGKDELFGGAGDDHIVFEADGGIAEGDSELNALGSGNDTLWITNLSLGTKTAADLTTDGVLRFDLKAQNLSDAAGYGGADVGTDDGALNDNQDQTNYKTGVARTTVQDFENVIATGLGAIDYDTDGTNAGDIGHTSQMNIGAYQGDLTLRGTDGVNVLYANTGNDVIEGRAGGTLTFDNTGKVTADGRDKLSGGDGLDDFIFGTNDGTSGEGGAAYGDGVDVIHRQADLNGDNIWDGYDAKTGVGNFVQDFGVNSTSLTGSSALTVDFGATNLALADVAVTSFSIKIAGTTFAVNDTAALAAANNATELAALVNAAFHAQDANVTAVASGNTVVITDAQGRDISDTIAEGYLVGVAIANGAASAAATFAPAGTTTLLDRLIYASYEDRADGELTDDNAVLGSRISLGVDAYAQDRVVSFSADGTRIAEDQKYDVTFANLTTQDKVTLKVNGVEYTLQVGVDLDGNIVAAEDGVGDTQPAIQAAFLGRLRDFINSFMDNDTAAGAISADLNGSTLTITQAAYNGEETVFMSTPTVTLENLSGGQVATAVVVNSSQHEVQLLDFDGRDGKLNAENVLFIGDSGASRSILATAKAAGGALNGSDAVLVDGGANDLAGIAQNTATNADLATNFSVHGDDLLIGGAGNDVITAGTGDDRVIGSAGTDTIDGGKNYYAVKVLGEAEARVFVLNTWEAANPSQVTALQGLTISSITLIGQSQDGESVVSGAFSDTLEFQQADFTAGTTRFTVTLNNFQTTAAGVVELRNGGAGTVGVDANGDGLIDSTTTFTNFENIRTVSGIGKAVASNGQGNDTLDVSALSTAAKGISYNLTNDGGAGEVRYSKDAFINLTADVTDRPQAGDFEEVVIKVDGVESVIGGLGDDLLLIDETEAAKNNTFNAGLGIDRVEYQNVFAGDVGGVAQPTITIKVGALGTDTDTVTSTSGRVGSTVAVDTLVGVEYIALNGNTGEGSKEADVLDVTALNAGAVVNYVNGTVKDLAGNTQVTIENLYEVENVWADGNDTVIVADADVMGLNARSDAATNSLTNDTDLALATFVDFDTLKNPGTDNSRLAFVNQTTAQIEDVINQNQFHFDLSKTGTGADTDTVDYSNANDNIAVVVELDATKPNQYVLVDSDGAAFYDGVGDLEEAGDRVDVLTSVERIVASQGQSVLDLTASTKGLEVKYQALDVTNRVAALDRDVYSVQVSDLASSVPLTRSYVEYRDAGQSATVTQATASWNRIEGSDNAERIILSSAHSDVNDVFNLRGGANEVKYNELTRSITATLSVTDFDKANALTTGLINATIQFQDGTGAGVEGPLLNGTTDTITSYTANNGVAAGSLRIAASQDAEDTLKFNGLEEKLFLLSETGTTDNQITVKLGSGAAQNSIVLTGFELVADSGSNDVYDFGSLVNAAAGLNFSDNAADHDTVKVGVDAAAVAFGGTATTISLAGINATTTLAPAGFDFDVLDVTKLTAGSGVTTVTGVASAPAPEGTAAGVPLAVFGTTDEVVIGKIDTINSALLFESVVFTQDTVAENGTTFVLHTDTNSVTAGSKTIALTDLANTLSFGGTVLEQAADGSLRAATALNATSGVNVTVTGSEAVNITGGNGNDVIVAGAGNDTLRGNSGNDTLDGSFTAEKVEVHTYTLTNPAGVAGETVIIDGVTITEGLNIGGVVVAENDADAIGAAFVRVWNATPAAFTHSADLSGVTYDALTNALTFTFTSAAGAVGAGYLGVAGGTADADAVTVGQQSVVSAETVTTAYSARAESADTFVFEATAALNGVDTLNNVDASDTLNFSAFLGAGNGGADVEAAGDAGSNLFAGLAVAVGTDLVTAFNKGTLAATDFVSGAVATAGKFSIADGDKVVFAVSADADGAADATINSWNLYYVENGATVGADDLTVTLVGTVNSSAAELSAANVAAML